MNRPWFKRAAVAIVGLLAATPLLGGCSSDDHHDRYGSSRDYDYGSRPAEYRPEPVPGYNARQARNAQRDAERYERDRYDRSYDYDR